jgi:hypothetical protein
MSSSALVGYALIDGQRLEPTAAFINIPVIPVAWSPLGNFIATGSPDISIDLLPQSVSPDLIRVYQVNTEPENCFIKNNLASNCKTSIGQQGVGIKAHSSAQNVAFFTLPINIVAENISSDNNINYQDVASEYITSQANMRSIYNVDTASTTPDDVLQIPSQHPVTRGTFMRNQLPPQIISQSGSYFLNENSSTITISADNVTLDLNGFSASDIQLSGIRTTIIIKNGIIGLISLANGSDLHILSCQLNNGLSLTTCNRIEVKDTTVSNVQTNNPPFRFSFCQQISLNNCIAIGNNFANQRGFEFSTTCTNISFSGCTAQNLETGFSLTNATNVNLKQCLSQNCTTGFLLTATGFSLTNATGVELKQCVAQDCVTEFILTNATRADLEKCAANNCVIGFSNPLGSTATGMVQECIANDNTTGFSDNSGCATVTYVANSSRAGTAYDPSGGATAPFYDVSYTDFPTYWRNVIGV